MFWHVVAEIFEQCHLLVKCLRKDSKRVKELGTISLNVLNVPAPQTVQYSTTFNTGQKPTNKISPVMVNSSQMMFLPTSKSHDTKTRPNIKNTTQSNFSLRIRGQWPVPIVNGGGDSFWKWPDFQLWRARDLDLNLGSGHTSYRCASLIDLYLHAKFCWNRRNFSWTDGRTYVRTNGRAFETGFIRSTLLKIRANNTQTLTHKRR